MESYLHTLCELFRQLGLPEDVLAIQGFIAQHRPLPSNLKLVDAPFWNEGQRAFLQQSLSNDADWAELVDQLDARLR